MNHQILVFNVGSWFVFSLRLLSALTSSAKMLLKENEIIFHDYEWTTNGDSKVPNSNVKLVSPFFNLIDGDFEYCKTFRFAIRVQGSKFFDKFQTIVYLYVNNVQQFGIEVKAVECTVHGETIHLETKFEESVMKIFKSNEFLTYDHISSKGISLKYRVYIGPIQVYHERSYGFELRDTRFGEDMWSAAQKGYMIDCQFVIQRNIFSAHRAIIATRCPQLAERIDRENNQVVINDDTNPAIFKALLYFLYTGNILSMDENSQRRFTALANTYNVKTVMQVRQFIQSTDRRFKETTEFFLDIQPALRNNGCTVEIRENYGVVSLVRRGIRLRYDFIRTLKLEESVRPEVFRFDKEGFFGVTLTVPQKNGRNHYQLTFSSFNLLSGFEMASVSFTKDNGLSETQMVKVYEEGGETCKIYVDGVSLFRQTESYPYVININFTVHLVETNECWGYRLHDPLLPAHYWSTTKIPDLADVELRVGNRSFLAHRAILSARSSVFNAMFSHDTFESQTGFVDITDLDPDVFQDFLVFLYTGRLTTSENMADLWLVANKYDVKTLERITELVRVRPRIEDLTVTLLSKL